MRKDIYKYSEAIVSNDVFLFGFPKSLGLSDKPQYDFNRPLLRKGALAGKNLSKKSLIIDCPSYGGNSGGPVVLKEEENGLPIKIHLIGIVIEFIPFEDVWTSGRYKLQRVELFNSGYGVVESMDEILELIYRK